MAESQTTTVENQQLVAGVFATKAAYDAAAGGRSCVEGG